MLIKLSLAINNNIKACFIARCEKHILSPVYLGGSRGRSCFDYELLTSHVIYNIFFKSFQMIKLLCLTAPFLVKAVLPKYHYLLWWDNHVDRSGYTFWCTQIYLHLFALIARVRLLQHIFTSLRPQN